MGYLKIRTWHVEAFVVGSALAGVTLLSDKGGIEGIGAAAVLFSFMHAQVADRLAEAEGHKSRSELEKIIRSISQRLEHTHLEPDERARLLAEIAKAEQTWTIHVDCHWKLKWYLVSKEIWWLIYFVYLGAWSALVGVGLFLLYPLWRHWYRSKWPVEEKHARREQVPGPD